MFKESAMVLLQDLDMNMINDDYAEQKNKKNLDTKLVDLHIFVVPLELWIAKYRTVYNNAVLESTSAGFIRVPDTINLRNGRSLIEEQLGHNIVPKDFIYLRSVGRCLAAVNASQEQVLQAKDFIPPIAYSPELFLLPCTHEDILSGRRKNQGMGEDDNSTILSLSSQTSENGDSKRPYDYLRSSYDMDFESNSSGNSKSQSLKSSRRSSEKGDVVPPVQIITSFFKTPSPDSKFSNRIPSPSQSSVVRIIKPELALVPDSSISLFPLPSARVVTSQQTSRSTDSQEVYSEKSKLKSSLDDDQEHKDRESNATADVLTLSRQETREEKVAERRNSMKSQKKKLIQDKMKETGTENNFDEILNLNTSMYGSRSFDPNNNIRLMSLEEKMKARYEKEQHRLKEEMGGDGNEGVSEEELISRMQELRKNSNSNSFVENNTNNTNEDRNESVNMSDAEARSESKIDRQMFPIPPVAPNQRSKTPFEDGEEVIQKIREIEEMKKKNKESIRKKQAEEEQKQKRSVEEFQNKKKRVEELKRELENIRTEKHSYQKEREQFVKKSRSLQAEVNSKKSQRNNAWRKKFVEERKRTEILEDRLRKTKNDVETQHRKLVSSLSAKDNVRLKTKPLLSNGGLPSERNNQKNQMVRLQTQVEQLKIRIDTMTQKVASESKMRGFAQQELKELREKAIEVKINASRAKKTLSP